MIATQAEHRTTVHARASVYAFLAWLYLNQPDADFVSAMLANDIQESLDIYPASDRSTSQMLGGLNGMRSSLMENGPRTLDDMCQALAVEHTRFLRGVGRAYGPPPPYESLYSSEEDREDNTLLVELTEFYRQAQAAITMENAERVDYLGIELDLMRLLCEEESWAIQREDATQAAFFSQLQQRFLRKHLLVWALHYCESFMAQTTTGFYRGVAQLLAGFLEAEAAMGDPALIGDQQLSGRQGQGS